MIKSVFFSRFDTDKGPVVLHQVPEGSVTPIKENEAKIAAGSSTPPRTSNVSPVPASPRPRSSTAGHRSLTPLPAVNKTRFTLASRLARRPLFDFASVSDFIIPRQEFCNQLLTVCANHYRIIGYPICIADEARYSWNRNEYIFNFCIVIDEYADPTAHIKVVKSVARMLRGLEEESGFLSRDEEDVGASLVHDIQSRKVSGRAWKDDSDEGGFNLDERGEQREDPDDDRLAGQGKVFALCEMLLEDLNNYCECMIPIDGITTLSIRLAQTLPPPPPVRAWHVPVPTVRLSSLTDSNWDLTMLALIPNLDGTRTVAAAARKANIRVELAKAAVQDLLYYGCVILLDAFTFGAIYAPTPLISNFVSDKTGLVSSELNQATEDETTSAAGPGEAPQRSTTPEITSKVENATPGSGVSSQQAECAAFVARPGCTVTRDELIVLYCSLRPGLSLRHWCADPVRSDILGKVDVRRLISYGIISGFLYRVHRYAATPLRSGTVTPNPVSRHSLSEKVGGISGEAKDKAGHDGILPLARYLDGLHCFDEMCTELQMSEREVMSKVRGHGDVHLISR